jgi:hypothetical protein
MVEGPNTMSVSGVKNGQGTGGTQPVVSLNVTKQRGSQIFQKYRNCLQILAPKCDVKQIEHTQGSKFWNYVTLCVRRI